ncbi:isochorismatase family protein [Cumulibacter soli]|uniref:isochorismatase family protein n=1 Tax=Cumulibacter soli TaxID=2546344 RepID=UPI0010680D2B|nr:isochorismatase family protein [Cumulibacter soli]
MPLPTLIDYTAPVPPITDLPVNRAGWALEAERAAILVHDMQEYFLRPFAATCPALRSAREAIARILSAARIAEVPVFYTAQQGDQDQTKRGLQKDLWGPGMSADPAHTDLVADLAPLDQDIVLTKHRYSAFYHSDLAQHLKAQGRHQLIIVGVYAHIGVTATALDAFQQEIHPFLVADGVADFSASDHSRALEQVAACSGVVVLSDEVVAAFGSSSRAQGSADWDVVLSDALARAVPTDVANAAQNAPDADMFELGLNSLQAFELLDDIADAGAAIDFGDFVRTPTLAFLRARGEVAAPSA